MSLNNVRLRNKILLLYFLAVFVPILLTNLVFYNVTTTSVKDKRMDDITRALEQVKREFQREVEDAVGISSVFYTDYLLNEIIDKHYDNPAEYVEAYDSYLRRVINSYSPVYHSVASISVYTDNPSLLYSGGIFYIDENIKKTNWYQKNVGTRESVPMVMRTGEGGAETFSILRRMDYFYYSKGDKGKILKIDLRMSAIQKIFSNLNLQGEVYLLNDRQEIEYTTNPSIKYAGKSIAMKTVASADNTLEFSSSYGQNPYLKGWSIVGRINEKEVFHEVRQSRQFVVLLTCLNILLPTLIIVWITRSLNVRLVRILKHMKKVKLQHFDPIPNGEYRDEIGQLTVEFNRMTSQIKSLIHDVYMADIQRKDLELQRRNAQLNALQSQINPHFLFNVLETIRMRSLMKDEEETARIIHHLAKLFRNSLVWSRDMVTLGEELEFIRCFLEIQKYRFGDKIRYEIHADEENYSSPLPKMTVLTFVENACIHGIEPMKQGGTIHVEASRSEEGLKFVVRDNGNGMLPETVERIYSYLHTEEEMGERIGIQNVIYRLKLFYGDRFIFRLTSIPSEGTEVELFLPNL